MKDLFNSLLYLLNDYVIVGDFDYLNCRENYFITEYVEEYLQKLLISDVKLDELSGQLFNKLKEDPSASKKKVVCNILEVFNYIDRQDLLIFFSGLYRVNLNYDRGLIKLELCDDCSNSFIEVKGNYANWQSAAFLLPSEFILELDSRVAIVEKMHLKGVTHFKVGNSVNNTDHSINLVVKRIQFESINIYRRSGSITWFQNIEAYINGRIIYIKSSTLPNISFENNSNTQEYALVFEDSTIEEIDFNKNIRRIEFKNTKIEKLTCEDQLFISLPKFDNKSGVGRSVKLHPKSFDKLLKSKRAGSIEFSCLAEFFNRNNAYMEAQQLHRHYLLSKAEESKNLSLKIWIWLYDFINGCGTSLLKPFLLLVLIFSLNCNINFYLVKITGVDVYYKAVDNILPFAVILIKDDSISNLGVVLSLKIISILATLLWFLIALQIRKLLKLKD
ncbi:MULTISPECIES: hypothetical protein [unclassified Francisella]|uniref:hypothetical protein n=1 Tax=unclassified Francisella TaxID=2610885 RepID=UPI002E3533C6|nr:MULTISPECIES: hypothetical protein [unclassified Francisella]MED7820231.1 hypothetical protein [Francisella sp. 19S2-4]MED7831071.1 hypothetical protein [Francisella sp. 19S2-10]